MLFIFFFFKQKTAYEMRISDWSSDVCSSDLSSSSMSGAAGARRSPRTKLPAGNHIQKGQPPVWRAALFGLCPECGAPTLFDGPVKFRPKCDSCGLDRKSVV